MKKIAYFLLISTLFFASCKKGNQLSDKEYAKLSEEDRHKAENALAGILVSDEELDVQLFASEPMMMNPTNMDIDAKGRVWVCEAYNYRNLFNPKNPYHKKGDRILILEDKNGDGKADTSKVFYQGEDINAALGIAVLGNKVIVSCSPNVFIFTDENGDDVADKKEILFKGIDGIQHDHAIHAVVFGPDGKLYFNFGNAGNQILDKNGKPLVDDLGRPIANKGKPYRDGMVFRCDIDGSHVEVLADNFRNNYEVAIDSYGGMWQSDNDDDGNKSCRINYVMDYGNYGFKDEITGADWKVRRTNWEDSIPQRHWHQNDPGVVPNMLMTGAGSPTGMVVYEGNLLPKKYQNQLIHCDAGPSVVRSYPVTKEGAGFKASINNILDASKRDQWFRPSDLTVAPDGSLFVADWYDQGVGGHGMGDTTRGRVFRIFPKGKTAYKAPKFNFDSPDSCASALKNANLDVRYLAWTKLNAYQKKAEPALLKLWKSADSRLRARALWLLANIKGEELTYITQASNDADEDIRMTALRIGRESNVDIMPILAKLANDKSPQVRREVALNLRHKTSLDAAQIWTILAKQYDGKGGTPPDRWYLEALGIGAETSWDIFLPVWLKSVGENWKNSQAAKDIIWRSRAKETPNLLAELIKISSEKERLRYFRAFDFQGNAVEKNKVLFSLLANGTASSDIKLLVFKHLEVNLAKKTPEFKTVLPKILESIKNPNDYFDVVQRYELKDQAKKLLNFAMTYPDSSIGYEAVKILVHNNGLQDFKNLAYGNDIKSAKTAVKVFGLVDEEPITNELIKIFSDTNLDISVREEAVLAMNGFKSEEALLKLVKADKIPEEMKEGAKKILLGTWSGMVRSEAAKIYGNESGNENKLASVAELVKLTGNVSEGKKVFEMYCVTCHQVNGKGINFGPTLSEIGSKYGKDGMYNAILNPDEGVSFGFENYSFKLKDGTEIQGILGSKTEDEVQIKLAGTNEPLKYKRSEVVKIEELKGSPMPKMGLKQQEMIDLVEYLVTLKKK